MNKQEYMYNLFEALRPFDEDVRNEIISDYEEHFTDGLACGKTEEQIVEELGPIDELIAELKDLKGKKKKGFGFDFDSVDVSKAADNLVKGIAGLVGSFAGTVTKGAEKMGESFSEGVDGFADSFTKTVTNAAEKVYNKGSEFAKDISDSYKATRNNDSDTKDATTDEANGSSDNCSEIVVEGDCANIYVTASPDNVARINYANHGTANQQLAYAFECYQKGSTLYGTAKRKSFGITNFFKSLTSPRIDLTVEVPRDFKAVTFKTASGEIKINGISAGKAVISDVSGSIDMRSCGFETLKINNISGHVTVDGVNSDDIVAETISGGINVAAAVAGLRTVTTSGRINILTRNAEKVDAATVSGSIDMKLDGCSGISANVSSVSGRIDLACGESVVRGTKSGKFTLGNGSVAVKASSVSGSISVEGR